MPEYPYIPEIGDLGPAAYSLSGPAATSALHHAFDQPDDDQVATRLSLSEVYRRKGDLIAVAPSPENKPRPERWRREGTLLTIEIYYEQNSTPAAPVLNIEEYLRYQQRSDRARKLERHKRGLIAQRDALAQQQAEIQAQLAALDE